MVLYSSGDVIYPDKTATVFDEETQNRINCLPAGFKSKRVFGAKWVSVFPPNPILFNLPNLNAVILLSEIDTGRPIVFMEGTMCSNIRTAALSALAGRWLARKEPKIIGFIGAGEQAKAHFLSFQAMFPSLRECRVASRRCETEAVFVAQMRKHAPNVNFTPCKGRYEQAVTGTDIFVTAISGQEAIVQPEWVAKGSFYCHVGGLEDDFGVARKADKIVCDDWHSVKHRSQTISRMYRRGLLDDSRIYGDLYEIVTGGKKGRENDSEFIYYNGVGLSYVDVAIGYWAYKKCKASGNCKLFELQDRSMFE